MTLSGPNGMPPEREQRTAVMRLVPSDLASCAPQALITSTVPLSPSLLPSLPPARRPRPSDQRVEWVRSAVALFERPLTQYALHILGGDIERARDLVQEAFLRLCDQDQQAIESHLAEWLYTVCRNLAIDQKRKERRMRLMTDEQEQSFVVGGEAPTEVVERNDTYGRVVEALQDLPTRQQEIVRLKFQHGMSYKQIAKVMNLTSTNVGFILHTAIKALREQLDPEPTNGRF